MTGRCFVYRVDGADFAPLRPPRPYMLPSPRCFRARRFMRCYVGCAADFISLFDRGLCSLLHDMPYMPAHIFKACQFMSSTTLHLKMKFD